ncbi:MAG: hypothetical protein Q8O24_05480 [Gallionellaceae bacterium]|jgi:hypothetical protein|nr:hypothetical protein [Gallionellaceae bacterium]
MFCLPENPVRKAIALAGGPTFVSNQLSLSNGAIHAWIRKGRIASLDYARKVAEMSGVAVEQLRSCR